MINLIVASSDAFKERVMGTSEMENNVSTLCIPAEQILLGTYLFIFWTPFMNFVQIRKAFNFTIFFKYNFSIFKPLYKL
jgi:hypothetical protein